MISPARLILEYLTYVGVAKYPQNCGPDDVPVVHGQMPPEGDRYVALMNTGAYLNGRVGNTGEYVRHPKFQVLVREHADGRGWLLCEQVMDALRKVGSPTPDGTGWVPVLMPDGQAYVIQSVSVLTWPMPIAFERDRSLVVYSANCAMTHAQLTPANVDLLFPVGGYG